MNLHISMVFFIKGWGYRNIDDNNCEGVQKLNQKILKLYCLLFMEINYQLTMNVFNQIFM